MLHISMENFMKLTPDCLPFLNREGFLPWKKVSNKSSSTITKRYHALDGTFYLIKIRPKKTLGLTEGIPVHYLDFFIQVKIQWWPEIQTCLDFKQSSVFGSWSDCLKLEQKIEVSLHCFIKNYFIYIQK